MFIQMANKHPLIIPPQLSAVVSRPHVNIPSPALAVFFFIVLLEHLLGKWWMIQPACGSSVDVLFP